LLRQHIASAFRDAEALLDLGDQRVDLVVRDAPAQTVPEIGIGGLAPDSYAIFIALDPLHPTFEQAVHRELARTVAHELHHLARRRAGCRGTTLWDAVVHEGLADHFSVELYGNEPPRWSIALPQALLDDLVSTVAEYGSGSFDHAVWFVGKNPATVPRWAGYAVGWHVVGEYLRRHAGIKPSQLAGLPADAFRAAADS
jgi:uncharacterized protein YjaZ